MSKRIQDTIVFKIASHILPLLVVYFLPKIIFGLSINNEVPRMRFMFHINLFLGILFFYLNKYIFVPRFFLRQRYFYFGTTVTVSLAFAFIFTKLMHNVVMPYAFEDYYQNLEEVKVYFDSVENFDQLDSIERLKKMRHYYNNFIKAEPISNPMKSVFVLIITYAISTSLSVTKKWHQNELQKKELAKDHFETELLFLKSQINPHFLFNTLNGIYSLAIKKSDKTPNAIVKLSALIRYMLYDSNKDYVELDEELTYIRNYIELQSLRLHDDISLKFNINGKSQGKLIAPMLMVAFIENAFKHGIDYTSQSFVNININIEEDKLSLKVTNSKNKQKAEQIEKSSGIGLKNVKRRLELLYSGKHLLSIKDSDDTYDVSLTLLLNKHEMLNS